MKKLFHLLVACFWLFLPTIRAVADDDILSIAQNAGYPATADIAPKSAIVINADNGQIVWGQDIDLQRDPASTTKTMVIYLTMEAIKAGKITMETEVVATPTDQAIAEIYALSNNKIQAGVSYTVSELLAMTFVPSSNIATLMLAHLIFDGTDGQFVDLMNQTAQELGMTDTVFHNGTGAIVSAFEGYYTPEGYDPNLHNLTTTKDLANLNYHLIKKHPEVLQFTKDTQVTVKEGTPYEETFDSYNHSLPNDPMGIEGVDGLKTGSSPSAGYNAIVTAKRGDTRLIVVVLGASQWGDPQGEFVRHYFINGLLEHVFANYEKQEILPAGQHKIDGKTYELSEPLTALVKQGADTPTVHIADGQVVIDQSQAVVGQVGVPAKEVSSLLGAFAPKAKTAKKSSNLWDWMKYGLLILLLMASILVVAVASAVYRRKQRRRNRRRQ